MLKKYSIISLAVVMAASAAMPGRAFAQSAGAPPAGASPGAKVYVDGRPSNIKAYFLEGYNYAKPRDIAEALSGAAQFEIPNNMDSVQYYKLRDIARKFDFGISWDAASKAVYIDTSLGYSESGARLSDQDILQTAHDAYIYALPLVIMDLTIKNLTNVSESGGSPINQFKHSRTPATADDKQVVRPNIDTPYSSACLDLSAEPLVFSKPQTDRYCSIAIYDAYTNCAAILGTGGIDNGKAASYLLCGPDYTGPVPDGLVKVEIPTDMAWMLVRTEYLDEGDLPNVHAIQDMLSLIPLSQSQNPEYVPPKGSHNPENDFVPFDRLKEMDIEAFFDAFNRLAASNPGTISDEPCLKSFAEIGIGAGLDFALDAFSEQVQKELKGYPGYVINELLGASRSEDSSFFHIENNWRYSKDNIARFGTDYEFRALVSLTGLGANPVEMAVYPSTSVDADNETLNGKNNYIMQFGKDQFPPCGAFWSITAYDKDGFLIHNPINKYAIRGNDSFTANQDGTIDIYIQSESPGEALEANWIPVPKDYFQLTLRIYLPGEAVLDLSWKPPYVVKAE